MPRIKLTAIVAGPDYRGQPGEIIEVPVKEAQQLIAAQAALPMASHDEGRATGPGPAEAGNGKPEAAPPVAAEGAASQAPQSDPDSTAPVSPESEPSKPGKKTKAK